MGDSKATPQVFKNLLKTEEVEDLIPESEGTMFEAIASKLIDELLSSKTNLKMKSDLNLAQITNVTRAYIYAEHFGSQLMHRVADTLLELLISKNRLGRKELTDLARSLSDYSTTDDSRSRMDILTGKGL